MDLLASLFTLVPITASLDARCHFEGPWQIEQAAADSRVIHFHIVLRGEVWLEEPTGESLKLEPGDIVLFPGGGAHRLHDGCGDLLGASTTSKQDHLLVVTNTGDEPTTNVLCGRLFIHGPCPQLLLRHLPARLVVHSTEAEDVTMTGREAHASVARLRLRQLVELMLEEALEQRPGSATVLKRMPVDSPIDPRTPSS